MKIFYKGKDGGPDSTVTGYWLIESERLFSVVLLKFEGKSREMFHNHAFNCLSWVLKGVLVDAKITTTRTNLVEQHLIHAKLRLPSIVPFITRRTDMHKVDSQGTSWVLSIRGPWSKNWQEMHPTTGEQRTLSHGRVVENEG